MSKEEFVKDLANKLKKLETNVQLEKRIYVKEKLKLEIKAIRGRIEESLTKEVEVKENNTVQISKENILVYNTKEIRKNKENQRLEVKAKEIYLENLVGCTIYAHSEESLFISNCINCQIFCTAKQIRLTNSSKIFFDAFTYTGIFIEKSNEVKIKERKEKNNFCCNVKDFSAPFSSKNYKFVN
ncbi:hypothetical protein TUBRATIS_003540 [Tubulinosema ratisbonensis]|uniref:C-CAP/cofactor C-like domain-containing protein n=1 Tax=Tubulinosema ratisbonensis TaxID=291195 RepID=A0A437APE5_9MICR|nr:hypothetical protein TUBRATIS_003540 [Tubulinosema ratisbonensis]